MTEKGLRPRDKYESHEKKNRHESMSTSTVLLESESGVCAKQAAEHVQERVQFEHSLWRAL